MKKIIFFLQIVLTSSFAFGKVAPGALSWNNSIYPTVHIIAPSKYYFNIGDDVYVKLVVNDNADFISYVDLFLGKVFIGRDNSSPYEWCKPNATDHAQLRNMASGKYSISAVVKYVDSKKKVLSRKFEVKSPYAAFNQYAWLKKLSQTQPNCEISEYRKGSQSYFKMVPCHSQNSRITWYDADGKVISQTSSLGIRFVKSWFDPCH